MKRALLIAGGTVGGLGAVLSITPPQLSSQGMTGLGLGSVKASAGIAAKTTTSQSPTAVAPQSAAPVAATPASAPASSATTSVTKKRSKKTSTKTKIAAGKVATTPTTTKSKTPVAKKTTTAPAPAQTTTAPAPAKTTAAPAPAKTTAAPAPVSKGVSGTFTGGAVNVNYGIVQVQITVSNGKITDVQAIQTPTGRSGQFSTYAVPILRQETLAAQSSQINGVSGASYTSYGWYTSLQQALTKAGLPL